MEARLDRLDGGTRRASREVVGAEGHRRPVAGFSLLVVIFTLLAFAVPARAERFVLGRSDSGAYGVFIHAELLSAQLGWEFRYIRPGEPRLFSDRFARVSCSLGPAWFGVAALDVAYVFGGHDASWLGGPARPYVGLDLYAIAHPFVGRTLYARVPSVRLELSADPFSGWPPDIGAAFVVDASVSAGLGFELGYRNAFVTYEGRKGIFYAGLRLAVATASFRLGGNE
jgi:hypothetical protein